MAMTTDWHEPFKPGDEFLETYKIQSLLGRGGHAFVYAGQHQYLRRPVAIKIIPPPSELNSDAIERGRQEAEILSRVEHPNVVKVYDAGVTKQGVTYIIMELLKGRTLRAALQSLRSLTVLETLHVGIQIAEAVQAAHSHPERAIHRDLKPENVFILPGNAVKVLDFGISKLLDGNVKTTQPNLIRGTPQYMSPEQMEGRPLTAQSDIFALGSMLYELLAAIAPALIGIERPSNFAIGYSQIHQIPPHLYELSPDVPRYVDRVIRCMLGKSPSERQASMTQVASELRSLQKRYTSESPEGCLPLRELWQATRAASVEFGESTNGIHSATTTVGQVVLTDQVTVVVPSLKSNVPNTTRPMEPIAVPASAAKLPNANSRPVAMPRPAEEAARTRNALSDSKELVARAERLIAKRVTEQRAYSAPSANAPVLRSARRSTAVKFLVLSTIFGSGAGYGILLVVQHSGAASISRDRPNISSSNVDRGSFVPSPHEFPVKSSAVPQSSTPAVVASVDSVPTKLDVRRDAVTNQTIKIPSPNKAATPATTRAPTQPSSPQLLLRSDGSDDLVFGGPDTTPTPTAKPPTPANSAKASPRKRDQLIFGADDLN